MPNTCVSMAANSDWAEEKERISVGQLWENRNGEERKRGV
jgi:hypothetical protein